MGRGDCRPPLDVERPCGRPEGGRDSQQPGLSDLETSAASLTTAQESSRTLRQTTPLRPMRRPRRYAAASPADHWRAAAATVRDAAARYRSRREPQVANTRALPGIRDDTWARCRLLAQPDVWLSLTIGSTPRAARIGPSEWRHWSSPLATAPDDRNAPRSDVRLPALA